MLESATVKLVVEPVPEQVCCVFTLIVQSEPSSPANSEEITAKRGQLKFPKADEIGTIPNNLLTMFNSLVNLFRKNVRVTKRALR